jgi:hypothetical protein
VLKFKLQTLTNKKPAKGYSNPVDLASVSSSIGNIDGSKIIAWSCFVSNSESIQNAYSGKHQNGFALLSSYYNSSAKSQPNEQEAAQGFTQKNLWKVHQNPILNEFSNVRKHPIVAEYLSLLVTKVADDSIESKYNHYRLILLFIPTTRKLRIIEKYLNQEVIVQEQTLEKNVKKEQKVASK